LLWRWQLLVCQVLTKAQPTSTTTKAKEHHRELSTLSMPQWP
jgi:hypothetical protein